MRGRIHRVGKDSCHPSVLPHIWSFADDGGAVDDYGFEMDSIQWKELKVIMDSWFDANPDVDIEARNKQKWLLTQEESCERNYGGNRSGPSGYVYLAKGNSSHKIGHCYNVNTRLRELRYREHCPVELLWSLHCQNAPKAEAKLQHCFRKQRDRGEWFLLVPEDVEFVQGIKDEQGIPWFLENEYCGVWAEYPD